MKKNIPIFFAAEFLKSIFFAYAIATLFYRKIGIDYTQLGMLWLGMALTQVLLEIPFGIISDKIGHRSTILLGYASFACGILLIGSGNDFWLPFIGSIMWGVSCALLSGASDAFLYDSLKHYGQEGSYLKMKGYHSMFNSFGIIAGAIPGAYLYAVDIRYPWYAHGGCIILGLLVLSFSSKTPVYKTEEVDTSHFKSSFQYLIKHKELLWLTLFLTLATFPLYGISMIRQPYLIERQFKVVQLGYIFTFIEAMGSVVGYYSHRLERLLGVAKSLLTIIVSLAIIYFLLAVIQGQLALIPLTVMYLCFRFQAIILNAYSNQRIPSEQRATILSIQSMGRAVLMIGFMLSSGVILDLFSLNAYLLVLSVYVTVILLPLWIIRKRFQII